MAAPEPYTPEQFRSDLATLGIPFGQDFDADLPSAMHRLKARHSHPDRPGGSTEAMQRLNLAKARVEVWIGRGRPPSVLPPAPPPPPPVRPNRSPDEERHDAAESARQAAAALRQRRQKPLPEEARQEAAATFEQARDQLRRKGPKAKPAPAPPPPIGIFDRIPGPVMIIGLGGLALIAITLSAEGNSAGHFLLGAVLYAAWRLTKSRQR